MKRQIKQWGPRSNESPVRATIDDRCPKCEGVVVFDDTNKRDECEACGQPIKAQKLPRFPGSLYD